jgi:hypothetical protein
MGRSSIIGQGKPLNTFDLSTSPACDSWSQVGATGVLIHDIALAGRRVDPPDASEVRFPASAKNIEIVRQRIRNKLQTKRTTVIVSSAACGSDLLALSEAGNLGLRRRVVLPFDRDKFRTTSVTNRPGDWVRYTTRFSTRSR